MEHVEAALRSLQATARTSGISSCGTVTGPVWLAIAPIREACV